MNTVLTPQIWEVASLCRAVADLLDARFNPVAVRGEISGFTRAASGHCYFTLKDPAGQNSGQIRCAMFRRAVTLLDFSPKEGDVVEVRGRVDVYGARGELQLIVESMRRSGLGNLFEQFLQTKARLEKEGLFAVERKRPLSETPRGIGVVTSLAAAALADVVTTLRRRAPHVPVFIANASVQGAGAADELQSALRSLYESPLPVDVILLVRGGGALDDLASFNDERLARVIAQSPVPLVSGVGHDTDFTIADFVADHRAPTPTAAAELAAVSQSDLLEQVDDLERAMGRSWRRHIDGEQQRIDDLASQFSRPSHLLSGWLPRQDGLALRLHQSVKQTLKLRNAQWALLASRLPNGVTQRYAQQRHRVEQLETRLQAVSPQQVLDRGYAWVTDEKGRVIREPASLEPHQVLNLRLAKGQVKTRVQ